MSNQPPLPDPQQPYQYPQQPYAQATTYGMYNPYAPPRTPYSTWCRVAAVVQMVIGSLTGLMGFCVLAAAAMLASGAIATEQQAELESLAELGDKAKAVLLIMGGCTTIGAIAYVALGVFVWKRSAAGIVTSLIFTGCLILLILANTAFAIFKSDSLEPLCANGVMEFGLIALLVLLILAYRDARRMGNGQMSAYQQWQQYYQTQYQAQAGQQAAPPMPAAPPPAPQSPERPEPPADPQTPAGDHLT